MKNVIRKMIPGIAFVKLPAISGAGRLTIFCHVELVET
jgi:hypothetical protein